MGQMIGLYFNDSIFHEDDAKVVVQDADWLQM